MFLIQVGFQDKTIDVNKFTVIIKLVVFLIGILILRDKDIVVIFDFTTTSIDSVAHLELALGVELVPLVVVKLGVLFVLSTFGIYLESWISCVLSKCSFIHSHNIGGRWIEGLNLVTTVISWILNILQHDCDLSRVGCSILEHTSDLDVASDILGSVSWVS